MQRMMRLFVVTGLAAGCGPRSDDGPCRCTPDNRARTRTGGSVLDTTSLLARVRRHQRDVAQRRPARDVKLGDDELRLAVTELCQPCGDWVDDRSTVEAMFPLDRLDDATGAVCLGLVLRDGTTAWGDARPRACR